MTLGFVVVELYGHGHYVWFHYWNFSFKFLHFFLQPSYLCSRMVNSLMVEMLCTLWTKCSLKVEKLFTSGISVIIDIVINTLLMKYSFLDSFPHGRNFFNFNFCLAPFCTSLFQNFARNSSRNRFQLQSTVVNQLSPPCGASFGKQIPKQFYIQNK